MHTSMNLSPPGQNAGRVSFFFCISVKKRAREGKENEKREREIFVGDDVDETSDILSELNVITMCSEPNRCANLVHRL